VCEGRMGGEEGWGRAGVIYTVCEGRMGVGKCHPHCSSKMQDIIILG